MKKFLLLAFISLSASLSYGSEFYSLKSKKSQELQICKPSTKNKKQDKNLEENPCVLKSVESPKQAASAPQINQEEQLQLP